MIWIISLATYEPADPVWFFSAGLHAAPANFAGRVGAFLAELSFQLVGYAAYLIPALLVVIGWHYFWCRRVDAAGTKATGALLLLSCISAFLGLIFGTLDMSGKPFRAGGYAGEWLARELADEFNRTGALIVILTLIFLAIIISTQFSFGRLFSGIGRAVGTSSGRALGSFREWREERSREQQRREVIAKHTKKGMPPPEIRTPSPAASPVVPAPAPVFGSPKSFAPAKPPKVTMPAPPLPDPEPIARAPAERRKGEYTLPPLALLDAPKTERKIDERELMDGARLLEEKCREFAVEGAVAQIHPGPVVTTYEFKPDAGVKYSKITGLADDLCLAMQAESVLIDRIPGKSTVGIQIPNRNREQISLRELLESGGLPPIDLEVDHRARQDDSRRAVHGGPGHDAASADRRIDRRRKVRRHQRHADEHSLSRDPG